MSFKTVNLCAADVAFSGRISACIAKEQNARGEEVKPDELIGMMMWAVASESDVEAAYASALAAGNPDPGGDEAVITDGMILSSVQANWPSA